MFEQITVNLNIKNVNLLLKNTVLLLQGHFCSVKTSPNYSHELYFLQIDIPLVGIFASKAAIKSVLYHASPLKQRKVACIEGTRKETNNSNVDTVI